MMRAACVDVPGGPESLLLRTVPRPEPKHGEVLIKVHATALNRADLLQRRGLYPPPPGESDIIGLEVAGTVDTLGPGVKRGWRPEDRVMTLLCGGGYAEYVAVPEELLMPVPQNLTLCQAAAIPEAWLTAFQLLALVAQVKEGEVVLVHAGGSGVGTAAIQLVRLFGAVSIVTAGSTEKLKMAEKLGAAAGFNYKEENFAQGVHNFTGGRGAEVILDCIGGCNWEQNVSCLASDGCCTAPWEAEQWREIFWGNCSPSEDTCSAASSAPTAFSTKRTWSKLFLVECYHISQTRLLP